MDPTAVAMALLIWLVPAGLTALVAHSKGYSFGAWLLWGSLFGVIALIVIAMRQPMNAAERAAYEDGKITLRVLWNTLVNR